MTGIMNPIHLAFIAMIALIFLGPKRLPELAKTIGSGMREFRETMSLDPAPDTPAAYGPPVPAPVTAAVAAPVPPLAPALAAPPLAPVPPLAPPVAIRPPAPVPPLAPAVTVLRPRVAVAPPQPPDAA
jgi:TatA/E family protein of Tat protein translocase